MTEESCSGSDLRAQLSAGKRKSFHDVAGGSYSCTCLQSAESAHTHGQSVGTLVRKVSFVLNLNDLCGSVGSVQTAVNRQNSRNRPNSVQ